MSLQSESPRNLILGIDPGLTGAIAAYHTRTKDLVMCVDMPVFKNVKKNSNKVDLNPHGIAELIESLAPKLRGAILEDVAAAPKQGVVSMFNFGYGQGILYGILIAYKIPVLLIKPQVWKSNMGLTRDKDLSRRKAMRTYPMWDDHFSLKKHDGRAEAALLAKYGERVWKSLAT